MYKWTQWGAAVALAAALCGAGHAQILIGQTAGFSGQVAAGVKETTDGACSISMRSTPRAASTARRSN